MLRLSALIVAAVLALASPAFAQTGDNPRKLALLIGNADYVRSVGALRHSTSDVETVRQALTRIGFADGDITILTDVRTRAEIEAAVEAFAARLEQAGGNSISFVYYAGHGAADESGRNFIIPIGVGSLNPALLWDRSYPLERMIARLGSAGGEHVIVFDACRNELNLQGEAADQKGFTILTRDSLPAGVFLAFSTSAGTVADDNGSYAATLAEELVKSNRLVAEVFLRVTNRIATATDGRQQPWYNNNLRGEVYLAGKVELVGTEATGGDELTAEPMGAQLLTFVADNVEVQRGLDWKSGLVEVRGKGSTHMARRPDEILLVRKGERVWVTYDSEWGQAYVERENVSVQ